MVILKNHEREYVENVFRLLENEVRITLFTKQPENQASRETFEILEEISSISNMIKSKVSLVMCIPPRERPVNRAQLILRVRQ